MFNIGYQNPVRHATWLELFFDLVFVAAIGIVTHELAHTHDNHISFEQLFKFILVFTPMWWIWITHTLYANRFDENTRGDKIFAIILMGLVVFLAVFAKGNIHEKFNYFIGIYVFIRIFLAYGYIRVSSKISDEISFTKEMALGIFIGAIISCSALFLDSYMKYIVFYLGILVDIIWQYALKNKLKKKPIDKRHLVERLGLLAIIILGESMINIVAGLTSVEIEFLDIFGAITGFILICTIWWIYFDSYHLFERSSKIDTEHLLIFMHLFLCIGLLILANLIKHSIVGDLDAKTFSMLAIIGLNFFYLGKQLPYLFAFPPYRKMIIINTSVCITLTVLSTYAPKIEYALFGMMMSMFVYVFMTYKWILSLDVDKYLEEE
mgnify:CR=1 FL=1